LAQNDFNSENVENVEGGECENVDDNDDDEMIANDENFGKDAMDDDEYNEENDSSEDDYSFSEEEDEDIKDEGDEEKEDEQEVSVIRRRVVRRDRSSTRKKVQKVGRVTKYVQVKKNESVEQTLTNGQNNADLSKQANGETEETNNENEQEKDEKLRRSTRRKTVCSKLLFDRYLDGDEDQVTTDQQKYYVADSLSGLRQKNSNQI